jgi:SM-20-related protein
MDESVIMRALTEDRALSQLMREVAERGFAVVQGLFDEPTLKGLSDELERLAQEDELRPARVGRGEELQRLAEVRGDLISWLPPPPTELIEPRADVLTPSQAQPLTEAERAYYERVAQLMGALNRSFFVGAKSCEFHYARYASGAGYQRHSDRFRGSSARLFSVITYLNPAWLPEHGGALRLYLEEEGEAKTSEAPFIDVPPLWGYTVCFESERFEHEVLPAFAPRQSVTGWLRG